MVRHRVAPKMGKLPAKAKTYISPGFSDNLAGFYSYLVGVFHWAAIGDRYKVLGDSYGVLRYRSTLNTRLDFVILTRCWAIKPTLV